MAEGLLRLAVAGQGGRGVEVDSAGTRAFGGDPPDTRACAAVTAVGAHIGHLRSRRVHPLDFEYFSTIAAMDHNHLHQLSEICPTRHRHKLVLLLQFATGVSAQEVSDPYFGPAAGFRQTVELLQQGIHGLLKRERFRC